MKQTVSKSPIYSYVAQQDLDEIPKHKCKGVMKFGSKYFICVICGRPLDKAKK